MVVQASPTMTSEDAVPTLTFNSLPGAGNAIIVGVTCISDHNGDCIVAPGGVTDNHGNLYTRVLQGEPILSSAQGVRGYVFIAENTPAPSDSFVISVDPEGTTSLQRVAWGAIEVSGLAAAPSLDAWGISLASASATTMGTATTDLPTVQANELAVAVMTMRSNDTNMLITPQSSWVSHHSAGPRLRSASSAARAVDPVARPSSTPRTRLLRSGAAGSSSLRTMVRSATKTDGVDESPN